MTSVECTLHVHRSEEEAIHAEDVKTVSYISVAAPSDTVSGPQRWQSGMMSSIS